ncbi:hypothetical protein MN608_00390 [Microdochium nivale]|nr:hypothetical protein MN608_00390 [Microdochium nivale]
MTKLQTPLSIMSPSDDPPLYFGGGNGPEQYHPLACREYPAARRILSARGPLKGTALRQSRQQRRPLHHFRQPQQWDDDGRSLAADGNIVLPSDRGCSFITADSHHAGSNVDNSRRTPRLVRQEAFCAPSTSRDWRSLDYVDDDDELYRLGLLYDNSQDQHRHMISSSGINASPTWMVAEDEVRSARFSLDTICHSEPTYTVRMVSAQSTRRNGRPGYRYDRGNDDNAESDHDSEDERQRKNELIRALPTLTLDLSFTAFADNVQQAWPRRGCQDIQDGRYGRHREQHAGSLQYTSRQPTQHIIYELGGSDHDHDMAEASIPQCPGTPITQTPELVSDDEDIASDDADWFSLMEDGWTPVEEEVLEFHGTDKKSCTSPHLNLHDDAHVGDAWVMLGRGKT